MPVPAVKLNEGRGEMTIEWISAQLRDFLDGDHLKPEYKFERGADLTDHPAKDLHVYLNSYNHDGYTPLQTAIKDNNTEVVRFLLNIGPNDKCYIINVDHRHSDRYYTPLHLAIRVGNLDIIKLLIEDANASFGIKYHSRTYSPIYTACEIGNIEIVKIILEDLKRLEGKPFLEYINTPLKEGGFHTPLYIATIKGNTEVAYLMKDAGATLGGAEITKGDLEDILADTHNISTVKTLVNRLKFVTDMFDMEKIPGLSKTGGEGYSPLFNHLLEDVDDDNTEIIEFLIEHGFRLKPSEETDYQMARVKDTYKKYAEQVKTVSSPMRQPRRANRSRSRSRNRGSAPNRSRSRAPNRNRGHPIVSSPHRWSVSQRAPSVTRRRVRHFTRRLMSP